MNRTEHLLSILAEECAEVAQRVTKALRFGLTEVQSGQPLTNAQRITYELGDLMGMVDMLESEGHIESPSDEAIAKKRVAVEKYLKLSASVGTLEPTASVSTPKESTAERLEKLGFEKLESYQMDPFVRPMACPSEARAACGCPWPPSCDHENRHRAGRLIAAHPVQRADKAVTSETLFDFEAVLDEIVQLWDASCDDFREDAFAAAITRLKILRAQRPETPVKCPCTDYETCWAHKVSPTGGTST